MCFLSTILKETPKDQWIQDYKIVEEIGVGKLSTVYKGTHLNHQDHYFTIKVINNTTTHDFQKEIDILKKISHLNGVFKYQDDFYLTPEKLVIVGDYIQGVDLFTFIINSSDKLTETNCKRIFKKLIDIVISVHKLEIVHRDIKPENVIINPITFEITLIDWGLAFEPTKTNNREWCGSINYCCPELVRKDWYNGPEVDAWSLGATLYAILTKTLAFDGFPLKKLYNNIETVNVNWTRTGLTPLSIELLKDIFIKRITVEEIQRSMWLNT